MSYHFKQPKSDEDIIQTLLLEEPLTKVERGFLDLVTDVIYTLAIVAVILITAGFLYAKLDSSPAKKTVPDCGSCRLYKGNIK